MSGITTPFPSSWMPNQDPRVQGGGEEPQKVAPASPEPFPTPGHSHPHSKGAVPYLQGRLVTAQQQGKAGPGGAALGDLGLCSGTAPSRAPCSASQVGACACVSLRGRGCLPGPGSSIPGCHLPPAHPRGQLPPRGARQPVRGPQASAECPRQPGSQAEASSLFLEPGPSPDARIPAELSSGSN